MSSLFANLNLTPAQKNPYTEGKADENWNSKWGKGGLTAKLKAAQQCSDWGYYNHKIGDAGNWKFYAECYDSVPRDWSRPFSDEAAKEAGFQNRNKAAISNCVSKGYMGIKSPNEYKDHGTWNFSLKCANPEWMGEWIDDGCFPEGRKFARRVNAFTFDWNNAGNYLLNSVQEISGKTVISKGLDNREVGGMWVYAYVNDSACDVKWDSAVSGKDGNGSKITIQKCNDWLKNDPKSCFKSKTKPDAKHWIACAIGSSPGGIAPGDTAGACSPISKDANDFTCLGGQNCFAVTDIDVTWDAPVSGKDGNGSKITIQKCNDWINKDPKSCLTSKTKPKAKHWIPCAIGSSPGGIAPGDTAGACSPISKNGDDFNCLGGQNCFAVTDIYVNWGPAQSGCDRNNDILTVQQCNNWVNNNPVSCVTSSSKPNNIKNWVACDIGSPLDAAGLCGKITDNATQFPCLLGQQCYAITSKKKDSKQCPRPILSDPAGAIEDFYNNNKTMILIFIAVIIFMSSSSILAIKFA